MKLPTFRDTVSLNSSDMQFPPDGRRCVRLTNVPPSCAVVMKSGSPNFLEPSGPLQACDGSSKLKVNQSLDRPWGLQEVEAPIFQENRHMQVVRLSALRTGRLYPPPQEIFLLLNLRNWFDPRATSDTIGNRTRDLSVCCAVPQRTASPRAPRPPCWW